MSFYQHWWDNKYIRMNLRRQMIETQCRCIKYKFCFLYSNYSYVILLFLLRTFRITKNIKTWVPNCNIVFLSFYFLSSWWPFIMPVIEDFKSQLKCPFKLWCYHVINLLFCFIKTWLLQAKCLKLQSAFFYPSCTTLKMSHPDFDHNHP